MVTEEDVSMVSYFYFDKGNIERWINWEDRKEDIFKKYPELKQALDMERSGAKLAALVIKNMESDG